MMVLTIAARELRSLFLSPLAWSILGVVQFILAYMFSSQVDVFLQVQSRLVGLEGAPGVTELVVAPVLYNAGVVLLLVVPMLTMRLISEERRSQTLSLLFSAPVSMTEIVLGKFCGVMGFLLAMVLLIALMPLSLLSGTSLDLGMFGSGVVGLTLLLASFVAIGLFMSTLTVQPTIAAVSTFGILLLLWILDLVGSANMGTASSLFAYLSILRHFESLLKGVFDTSDVIYYLLFVFVFLIFSIRRLDADRLQH